METLKKGGVVQSVAAQQRKRLYIMHAFRKASNCISIQIVLHISSIPAARVVNINLGARKLMRFFAYLYESEY